VNAVAVRRVRRINRAGHRGMIGLPAIGDARLNLVHGQQSAVDGLAAIGGAPDQALAQPHLGQHHWVGFNDVRPGRIQQSDVNFGGVAVGVQVTAREMRLNPMHPQIGRKTVEFFHVRVLGLAKHRQIAGKSKVFRVTRAAVRGVQHQRSATGTR